MQQEEAVRASPEGIFRFSMFDPFRTPAAAGRVARQGLVRGVAKVGQQAKWRCGIPVREVMDLQGLDEAFHTLGLVSIVGTTTMVRQSGAMPVE
jgi:hypothetical protein